MAILVYNSQSRTIARELLMCPVYVYIHTVKIRSKPREWHVPIHLKTPKNAIKRMYNIQCTSVSRTAHFQNYTFLYRETLEY